MGRSRTQHMVDRMRQRSITEDEIGVILEHGEWNRRTDRLVLSAQACARAEEALRKEIAALEYHAKQPVN